MTREYQVYPEYNPFKEVHKAIKQLNKIKIIHDDIDPDNPEIGHQN